MFLTKKILGLAAVCMLWALLGASQAAPVKIAPGSGATDDYLYVFGPQAAPGNGKDDMLQIVFFEYPAATPSVELYVWDPGSGKRFERSFFLKGFFRDAKTRFTVYGGKGAYSDAASRSVRPQATQPGNELSTVVYDTKAPEGWVSLGTYNTSDAEVINGTAYLKLAVQGIAGDGANFFKVGISEGSADIFSFDITLHLATEENSRMEFKIPATEGVTKFVEENYDMDAANIATLSGQSLTSSGSGEWVSNAVTINNSGGQLIYHIVRGSQGFSNAGFHVSENDGNGLPMYFSTTIMPSVPQEAPEPEPIKATDGQIDTSLLTLTKSMPSRVAIGEEFAVTLLLRAKTCIGDVVVTDMMPDGLALVSSDPQAKVSGKTLTWTFDRLAAGEEKQINLVCRATGVATYENCMTVKAIPLVCTDTVVGKPELKLVKSGPAEALLGSNVVYTITVSNSGNYAVKDILITDNVPEGMSHASGQRQLQFKLAELPAGQSRDTKVTLRADKRGKFCNTAEAVSANAGKAQGEACTVVKEPILTITKKGTAEQFIGKEATYNIEVSNPGDTDLTDVVVVDTIPEGTTLVSAPDATVQGRQLTWRYAKLEAGKKIVGITVTVTSREPGTRTNQATVSTAQGLKANASAPTVWSGYPALLIEVIDTADPLQPGEETTYIITVTNQGTAADKDVRINAQFPAEITPVSASGDTEVAVNGKKVATTSYPSLKPGQVIKWTIKAKAVQAGDSRLSVELRSALLVKPVTEQESTQVY